MTSHAERAATLLDRHVGEGGVGEWHTIDQNQIDRFADATLDHQFIHIDPERAAAETGYGGTIAHGFLTLSLVVHLCESIPASYPRRPFGLLRTLNYGLDRVRFPAPVRAGARVRARRVLIAVALKGPDAVRLKHAVTVEIEGERKPACVAELLSQLVFAVDGAGATAGDAAE